MTMTSSRRLAGEPTPDLARGLGMLLVSSAQLSHVAAQVAAISDQPDLERLDAATRREAVRIAAGRIPLEVSGGVDLAGLRAIAEDGVDCISIGGLTKHVHAIDLSLKLGPPPAGLG